MYKIIKKKNKAFITKMLIAKAIVYTFLDIFLCIPNIYMYFQIKWLVNILLVSTYYFSTYFLNLLIYYVYFL